MTKHLSPHLLDYLDDYCKRHTLNCPLGVCVGDEERQPSPLRLTLIADRDGDPEFGQLRRSLRDGRCHQCTLILILQAIHRNVPAKSHQEWLNKPLIDLHGRTPRQCIESGDFDALIDALWLLDQSELTDG